MENNFLSQIEFRFTINRMPNVEYYIQKATLPSISSGFTNQSSPFKDIYRPGDKLTFGDFTIDVLVDEKMESYIETWNWLIGLTSPAGFDQYKALTESQDGLLSDASLLIMNSGKKPNIEVKFKDLFPTDVGEIQLDTAASDLNPITVSMSFKYLSYEIKVVT